jgi:hypothetical protein
MGISKMCVISLQCTYVENWGHYMVGLTCCVLGKFLSFQHINSGQHSALTLQHARYCENGSTEAWGQ